MVHIHVRDQQGQPTQDGKVFARTMELIRAKSDIIVQCSTGGAVGMSAEERLQPVYCDPAPDMVTFTVGSCNFGNDVFLNPPELLEKFARTFQERNVVPEIDIMDAGFVENANYLLKRGLIPNPPHYGLGLGLHGAIAGTPKNLLHLVELLPPGATWTVCGIGRSELPLAVMAILMGGHVRVGLEDNIFYSHHVLAESNAQLVARIVRIARELGREIATPDEAREILRLKPRA
jgi:3-keto-5-aminohexanoate cleavage enzyme